MANKILEKNSFDDDFVSKSDWLFGDDKLKLKSILDGMTIDEVQEYLGYWWILENADASKGIYTFTRPVWGTITIHTNKKNKVQFVESKKENKTMKKSLTEKRISTEDKIQALAEYKGVEIDEVEEGYDENHFEVDGEEWIVADYDTAYDLAVEYSEQIFDDLGLESVTESTQEYFLENEEYCSFPWKDDMHDSNLGYANDIASESSSSGYASRLVEEAIDRKVIKEKDCFENEDGELDYEDTDELAEMLADDMDDDYDSMSEWFESIYGRGWASEMKDTLENYLDYRAMAEYVVDSDGVANSLASWDGEEVELTKDLYGYRTN